MHHSPCQIVLIGSHNLFREGLARILRAGCFRIAASASHVSASHVEQGVLNAAKKQWPILLVIDAGDAPISIGEQIKLFKKHHPAARVVVLADKFQLQSIFVAFRAGANACFDRNFACEHFIKSLELVMLGESILPPAVLQFILDLDDVHKYENRADDNSSHEDIAIKHEDAHAPQLSVQETCILRCLTEGASNKVIARKIRIAESTVKVHIKSILRKVRVKNRTQAAIWAMNSCLFDDSSEDISSDFAGALAQRTIDLQINSSRFDVKEIGPALLAAADRHGTCR
jgi:two-component system nitrate/nitrite response regulator NarL